MKKNKSNELDMFEVFCDNYPVTIDKMKNFSHNDEKLGVQCKYHKELNIFEHTRLVYEFMKCNRYDDDMLLAGILPIENTRKLPALAGDELFFEQKMKLNNRYSS